MKDNCVSKIQILSWMNVNLFGQILSKITLFIILNTTFKDLGGNDETMMKIILKTYEIRLFRKCKKSDPL